MKKKSAIISYGGISQILTGSRDKIRKDGSKYRPYMLMFEKWVDVGFEILKARVKSFNDNQVNEEPFGFYEIYQDDKSEYMNKLYDLLSDDEKRFIANKYSNKDEI